MTPDKRVEEILEISDWQHRDPAGTRIKIFNTLTQHRQDLISEAVEAERKEWLSGNRCGLCGGDNLDSKGLSDVCGKCFEEQ